MGEMLCVALRAACRRLRACTPAAASVPTELFQQTLYIFYYIPARTMPRASLYHVHDALSIGSSAFFLFAKIIHNVIVTITFCQSVHVKGVTEKRRPAASSKCTDEKSETAVKRCPLSILFPPLLFPPFLPLV